MFFFGHFGRRAHVSRALRLPASETATFDCAFNAPDPLLRRRPAESLRAAHRWLGFGVRQFPIYLWHGKSFAPRRLGRLTSRSSRRRVVASLKLVGMRAILAPIRRVRRGLTPALAPIPCEIGYLEQHSLFWQHARLSRRPADLSKTPRAAHLKLSSSSTCNWLPASICTYSSIGQSFL